ncbi:hypothetical protein F66182_96 [Fusarium sp. NRRL 66182]|nr:hypothetical protein F66182_96 [Fusarium sp. NRRL 66182]
MLFRAIASVALLACATSVAAEPQPYKPVKAPVQGLSLARRSTPGYQPDQSICNGGGDTCAEACGTGYESCPSDNDSTHCFNPVAKQTCCFDGTGNSCDEGYYCTHDTKAQTWCCPDSMDLAECAAAYGVKDGLETEKLLTSTVKPTIAETTTAAQPTTTSELKTTSTTVYITSTSHGTTEPASTTPVTPTTVVANTTAKVDKTTIAVPSSGYSTAWSGSNSTIATAVPSQPSEPAPTEPSSITSGASTITGMSAMLLAAAGVFALL